MGRKPDGFSQRGGCQPRGTATLDQIRAKARVDDLPDNSLREAIAESYRGRWLEDGSRQWRYLYDERAALALLATSPPRRRRSPARPQPRLRKRSDGSTPPARGLPAGWATLAQLAAELEQRLGVPALPREIQRELKNHAAARGALTDELGANVIAALLILAHEVGVTPSVLVKVSTEKRVIEGRQRWTVERAPAIRVLSRIREHRTRRDGPEWRALATRLAGDPDLPRGRVEALFWRCLEIAAADRSRRAPTQIAGEIRQKLGGEVRAALIIQSMRGPRR